MHKPKILVTEALGPAGLAYLAEHAEVDAHDLLPPELLPDLMNSYDAVIIRSAHRLSRDLLMGHPRLRVVARAGAGVDNVDLTAATESGIAVINAPGANAIAAAEHTFGLLLAVMRNIPDGNAHVRSGGWDRQAFIGQQLHGKTLGIIGLGRVGREVARIARGFGMMLNGYDPYIQDDIFRIHGVTRSHDLDELLPKSSILTIHTPKNGPHLGRSELEKLPRGAIVINAARGGLIEENSLSELLKNGHLFGAGLDVFTDEPPAQTLNLMKNAHVVMTPHLGGSTHEALANVGVMTATGVIDALNGRTPPNIVNVPIPPLDAEAFHALDSLADAVGKVFATVTEQVGNTVILTISGNIPDTASLWLRQRILATILNQRLDDRVNTVNALLMARSHGLQLLIDEQLDPATAPLLSLRWEGALDSLTKAALEGGSVQLKTIRGIPLDLRWPDRALITRHHDAPGVVGKVGTLVGEFGVNIANLHLGRQAEGEDALMVLCLDDNIPAPLIDALMHIENMHQVYVFE